MPLVPFASLPDSARIWIFGAADPLPPREEAALLQSVDEWLSTWSAHGTPLTCARHWRDGRFLVVGVDQEAAGASGCSIDALYRVLQAAQGAIGTSLLGGRRVYHRDTSGAVVATDRDAFATRSTLPDDTPVFDTALTTAGAFRSAFEKPLASSWHRDLRSANR